MRSTAKRGFRRTNEVRMAAKIIKVDPFDLVVFGGTGDLAYRKLLSRRSIIATRASSSPIPTRIIGVSRRDMAREAFRASVARRLNKYGDSEGAAEIDGALPVAHRLSLASTPPATRAGASSRICSAPTSASAPITWRRARICSGRSPSVSARTASRRRARASSSKSRSATTASARRRSTTRSAPCSWKRTSSASTIISARKRCRT